MNKEQNNRNNRNKSEREKGAAPPDYMPAIFNWLNMEEQAEHAREIGDIGDKIENENKNKYKYSDLKEDELAKVRELEENFSNKRNEHIVLLAFEED